MNQLIELKNKNLPQIFTDDKIDEIVDEIENEVKGIVHDITTDKGRKEIASLGRKISSSKKLLDDAGKELTADWKAKSKLVDASRKKARDRLDSIRDEILKPLVEWRKEESDRVLAEQHAKEIDFDHDEGNTMNSLFDRELAIAEKERMLQEQQQERERIQAEKEADEKVEQEKRELEYKLKLEAEANAKRKIQDELDTARRSEQLMKEQAEQLERNKAYEEKQTKARAEQAEREKQQAILQAREDERKKQEQAAELKRLDEEARQRQVEEKNRNQAHRDKIHKEAVRSLVFNFDIEEGDAIEIIKMIAKGEIKNIKVIY